MCIYIYIYIYYDKKYTFSLNNLYSVRVRKAALDNSSSCEFDLNTSACMYS